MPNYTMLASWAFLDPSRIQVENGLSANWTERVRKRVPKPSRTEGKGGILAAVAVLAGQGSHATLICQMSSMSVQVQHLSSPLEHIQLVFNTHGSHTCICGFNQLPIKIIHKEVPVCILNMCRHPLALFPQQNRQQRLQCLYCIEYCKLNMIK